MTQWLDIGTITKPHGLHGEVRVMPQTDFVNERFADGQTVYLETNGHIQALTVAKYRWNKQFLLVSFVGYDSVEAVDQWRQATLKITYDHLSPLEGDDYYFHEIIGCQVYDEDQQRLGTITNIMQTGANDVWVMKDHQGKEQLIPYIHDVVRDVDVTGNTITIHVMEGLLS